MIWTVRRKLVLTFSVILLFLFLIPTDSDYQLSVAQVDQVETEIMVSPTDGFALSEDGLWKRYDKGGTTTFNSTSKVYSYSTSVGTQNVWNGTDYLPYIWNETNKIVNYAGLTLEFFDWYTTISNETNTLVDDTRWQAYYWSTQQEKWNLLDLYSHEWQEPILNEYNMTFGQTYTDGSSVMNVTYLLRNSDELKISIDFIPSFAGIFKFVWQVTGLIDAPHYLIDSNNYSTGIVFDTLNVLWNDVVENNGLNATLNWQDESGKVDIDFSNFSLDADELYILDPTITPFVSHDDWDDDWERDGPSWYHRTTYFDNPISVSTSFYAQAAFVIVIPKDATIISADLRAYSKGGGGTQTVTVHRLVDTQSPIENLGPLEDDSNPTRPNTDTSPADVESYTTTAGWRTHDTNIDSMIQEQVNKAGWVSGYYMGFRATGSSSTTAWWEDISDSGGANQAQLTATYATNNAPVNDQAPTSADLHDTDKLYAKKQDYSIVVYVSDADGYADIDYLELKLYSQSRATTYWTVRYDEDTNVFSEQSDPSDMITLNTGASSAVESGNDIDATFEIEVNWNHIDISLIDLFCYVIDAATDSDSDYYENDWTFETRLDWATIPAVTDDDGGTIDRGDLDEAFTVEGDLEYRLSASSQYPPADAVDVWVSMSEYGSSAGPWSDLTLASGVFSLTGYADDAVGIDTLTIKPVIGGAGSGGSSLYYTGGADLTDTYISDIVLLTFTPDDTTPDGGEEVTITVTADYDYGGSVSSWSIMVTRNTADWLTKTANFVDGPYPKYTAYIYSCSTFTEVSGEHGISGFSATPSDEVVWGNLDPIVDSITLDNPTDNNNLLPYYVEYQFTVTVTDPDGFADIDYLELTLYHYFTDYWIVRFDQDTSVFTVEYGGVMIDLSTTNSEYDESGNVLTVTFHLNVTWAHTNPQPTYPLADELSLDATVWDVDAATGYLDNDLDLDIHTKVTHSGTIPLQEDGYGSNDVGDYDGLFWLYQRARYYDGSNRYVPSSAMDVWVYQANGYYGAEVGPWSATTWATDDYWNVTCYADDVPGIVYYRVRYVAEGTGFSGTQLHYAYPDYTYMTGNYWSAQVTVTGYAGVWGAPVGQQTNMRVSLQVTGVWQYMTTGTWSVNGVDLYYSGSAGWWWINDTRYSPTQVIYDTVADASPNRDDTHGLSYVNQNNHEAYVIWSNYNVTDINVLDARVDYGTSVDVNVTLYDYYSNQPVTDEDVWINGLALYHIENGIYGLVTPLSYATATGVTLDYVTINDESNYNITGYYAVNMGGNSVTIIWDKVKIYVLANATWIIVDNYVNVHGYAKYMYDNSTAGVTSMTIYNLGVGEDFDVSYGTVGERPFYVTAFTEDGTYGITGWETTTENVIWDAVQIPSLTYYWTQETEISAWLHIVSGSWFFTYNNDPMSTYADGDSVIRVHRNGTDVGYSIIATDGGLDDLLVGPFGPTWYNVNITLFWQATCQGVDYNITVKSWMLIVQVTHSLQVINFNIAPTDYYFWITYQTNLLNASITIWDDAINSGTSFADNIYYSDLEGMHSIDRSTIIAAHNLTICITTTGVQYDRDYTEHDYVWWYNFTYIVIDQPAYDSHIVILNNLFELIPFDTFEVYKNGTRIYHDIIQVVNGYGYNITVKNRFGDYVYLNTTDIFEADFEMVIFVDTHSFKFMNWYNGFLRVNVTRGGQTYSEIIMPTEIIEFNLFEATYTFTVDFLNGTTKFSQEITVTNSTGYVITGDSLTDVFDLVNSLWTMTEKINITVTATNEYALTISIDLLNINSTIDYQLVQVLLNITNVNSTIFDQAVDLLAYIQTVNSTLYSQTATFIVNVYNNQTTIFDQTVTLLADIANIDSDIVAQTVTLLANIENVNSNITAQTVTLLSYIWNSDNSIYNQTVWLMSNITNVGANITAQTVTLLSEMSNINSNITAQTVTLLSYIWNNDNSIYNQTVTLLSNIDNIDSDIVQQTIDILADISNVNTTLYSQTVWMLANITNVNSTLFTQTVTIIANIENVNSTIYAQTVTLIADIANLDSDIVQQTIDILADISNVNATIFDQTVTLLADIENVNTTLFAQTVTMLANIANIDSDIVQQTIDILADIENVNSTIYAQTVTLIADIANLDSDIVQQTIDILADISNVNSTLYSQTLSILTNITNVNSTLYSQTVTILANIENVNSTIYAQTITLLADIANLDSDIVQQTIDILADVSNVNSTLYSQTLSILTNITNVNATIYSQTVTILANIENVNSTIYAQTVTLIADIANLDSDIVQQTIDILADISNVNSTLYSQTVTLLADIENVNTTIYTQTVAILSTIENVNSTIYSQTVLILSDISNVNSTLYDQTVTLLSNLQNVNSTIFDQTVTLISDISNVNSTLYTQTVTLLSDIANVNSTLYTQTVTILSNIANVNSTLYGQLVTVLSNLDEMNATLYAFGGTTDLFPMVLGAIFSADYVDFTVVTTWHNTSITVYENDEEQFGPVSELSIPIRHTLNTTIGKYNVSLFVDGGGDSFWYNVSYNVVPVGGAGDFALVTWDISWVGTWVFVTWSTTWGTSTITPYEDDSPASGTTEENTLQYLKLSTLGDHTLDFKVDGGTGNILWKNYTYTISTSALPFDWSYIYTYTQGGEYIDWENFVFSINGTEQPTNFFYNRTDYVYNITLTDIFGDTVYSEIVNFSRTHRLELAIHSFILVSELLEPIWVRLTSSGGGYKEVWLYRESPYEWWLYESKEYQWYWDIDAPGMGQPQGPHYYPTDSSWYTPDSALMYVMTGYGMFELRDDIPDPQGGGGGGLSEADKLNITQSIIDDIVALMNPLQGGPVGILLLAGFTALGYLSYSIPTRIQKASRPKPAPPEEDDKPTKTKQKPKKLRSRLSPRRHT